MREREHPKPKAFNADESETDREHTHRDEQ